MSEKNVIVFINTLSINVESCVDIQFNNDSTWKQLLINKGFDVLTINIPGINDNNFNYDWNYLKVYLTEKIKETNYDNLYFIGFSSSFPILHLLAQQVFKNDVKHIIGINPAWLRQINTDGIISKIEKNEDGSGLLNFENLNKRLQSNLLEDKRNIFDSIKKYIHFNNENLTWKIPITVYSSIFKELKIYRNNYLKLNYSIISSNGDNDVDQEITNKLISDLNCKNNFIFDNIPHFFIWSKNRFEIFQAVNDFLLYK